MGEHKTNRKQLRASLLKPFLRIWRWWCPPTPAWKLEYVSTQPPSPPQSTADLVAAIRAGDDVKVGVNFSGGGSNQTRWRWLLESVTITDVGAGDPIVSGMLIEEPDSWATPTRLRLRSNPPRERWQAFNTTGERRWLVFDTDTNNVAINDRRWTRTMWYARGGWRKIYENGADGTRVTGTQSFRDLIKAIDAGADLKIRYTRPGGVEWYRTFPAAMVHEDVDEGLDETVVGAVLGGIPDTVLDAGGRDFDIPYAVEWQSYDSNGNRHVIKFNRNTGAVMSDTQDSLGMTWFVRD